MEGLDSSVFIYHEGEQELRQKLADATLELETLKNVKMELFNLLKMAYQERDEARCQLQKLMNKLVPSSSIHLQNVFGVQHENLLLFPSTKANPSITESNSLSHGSPPVDSLIDTVSSPEFSDINVAGSNNNMVYINQHLVQDFNCSVASPPLMVPSENPTPDPTTAIIDTLAKQRNLPQKGKLLQAVMDAGPLLQTVILAGPLPTWQNPPPLQDIKVPPLTIKEYDITSTKLNSFTDTRNSFLKPKLPSLQFSNAPSTCSASMLNFAGQTHGSWNNAWQLSSTSSVGIQVPSRKRQRLQ